MARPLTPDTLDERVPNAGWRGGPIPRVGISIATGALPGIIAGFAAGGIGSRVVMRVMALTSSPQATGAETDFGATVGQITLGGTMFLLIVGTVLGAFGGMLYVAIRRWLPGRGLMRGLAYGMFLLAVFGRLIIDPNNEDFVILEPAGLAVALFASLFLIYGLMFVPLYERLESFVRRPRPAGRAWLLLLPVVIPMLVGGPVGIAIIVITAATAAALSSRDHAWWSSRRVDIAGHIILLALAAFGASVVLRAALDIV